MKIPKHQAVELLNEKILIFEDILTKISEENIYDSNYKAVISETETLLAKLFNYNEVLNFKKYTTNITLSLGSNTEKEKEETYIYKEHIRRCIRKLKVCMENFYDFPANSDVEFGSDSHPAIFLSPSCEARCTEIQTHLLEILKTLQLSYYTTRPYQDANTPYEVEKVISGSDVFICIIGRKEMPWSNYSNTAPELINELESAKKLNKKIIIWLEEGIKDLDEFSDYIDIIYFKVGDISSLRKATINFLEALKKYNVI